MSLNDPQWGKNRNDGPPDLDEMARKLKQKVAGLFGGSGGDRDPNQSQTSSVPPKWFGGGVALLVGVMIAVWLASGFYIVEEGKRGVVLRLGKYLETTGPGPRWHWPYPFESHEIVNVSSVQTVEVGYRNTPKNKNAQEASMLTEDENIVDVQFAVQYDLKDAEDFLFNNRDHKEDAVRTIAESAIREVVGKNKMDYVLNEGRSDVAAQIQRLLQTITDRYKLGVQIRSVTMQNAQPPEQVQGAFEDALRAVQDKERSKNEGEEYRNKVVPTARGLASRLMEEANGYKQRVIANAEGDASRFKSILVEYEKAPQVTRERLYLEAMQQIYSSSSKVMIDQKPGGGGNLLYLPLDKLMQASSSSVSVAEAAARASDMAVPVTPTPPPAEPARSGTLRNREGR